MHEIKPADVYQIVDQIRTQIYWLMLLVVIQIILKVILYVRVWRQSSRTEEMLCMVEGHASITDSQQRRISEAVAKGIALAKEHGARIAAVTVKAVEKVPDKTAEKVVEKLNDPSHSDRNLKDKMKE